MGHARVDNLSTFFVKRLYAKGMLSISSCVRQMSAAGETVHASEGEYEDDYMLGMALTQIVHYLTRKDPASYGYSGPREGGPWIEPHLSAQRRGITQSRLLVACDESPDDEVVHKVAHDWLLDQRENEWAVYVLHLPAMRKSYQQWLDEEDEEWTWDEGTGMGWYFDNILWKFCKGKRNLSEVPILSSITN